MLIVRRVLGASERIAPEISGCCSESWSRRLARGSAEDPSTSTVMASSGALASSSPTSIDACGAGNRLVNSGHQDRLGSGGFSTFIAPHTNATRCEGP
jgi:hypothetical protein